MCRIVRFLLAFMLLVVTWGSCQWVVASAGAHGLGLRQLLHDVLTWRSPYLSLVFVLFAIGGACAAFSTFPPGRTTARLLARWVSVLLGAVIAAVIGVNAALAWPISVGLQHMSVREAEAAAALSAVLVGLFYGLRWVAAVGTSPQSGSGDAA